MLLRLPLLILLMSLCTEVFSQSSKTSNFIDGTFSFAQYQGSLAIHYTHMWSVGRSQKLSFGVGGRITSYLGANQYYVTAPAELTSESTSPLIFFKDNITKNMDTLLVKSPQVTSINVSINIHYKLTSKLTAGFNIDALGFSFGAQQQGNYINGNTGKMTQASPTAFNVLLVSDNDHGSLNSEIFMKYGLDKKWSIKGGLQFLFTEYTTVTKVQQYPSENDRFRLKSYMFAVGVSYQLN